MESEARQGPSTDDDVFARLNEQEIQWRERQEFLQSRGYLLRPRYHRDWVPSWRGKSPDAVIDAEDGFQLPFRTNVIDATRESDGALVYLKRVRTNSLELQILSYLSSDELRQDPRNHCVPLLDVLPDPIDLNMSIMVMPFLRYIDYPPFETVEDVFGCLDQVLEGLVFIHDQGVAHRDCAYKNIMMDASALFPRGFHPVAQTALPDAVTSAPVLSRSAARVHYYFIDFGISTRFDPKSSSPRLVTGKDGLDQEPPELSKTIPYDPFKLDVFLIGNLVRSRIQAKYTNLTVLEPLIAQMVHPDPAQRPTAAEAYRRFQAIRRKIPTFKKYWLLQPRDSSVVVKALRNVYSLCYAIYRSMF
ncbi:hypothetical protein GY45DRAFT_1242123 [Cubamyces sp. BRFM 1775]|nr:hypothetical protein GY45DRAFT_1242123 [Cubamyces sp. BRFM 1775]